MSSWLLAAVLLSTPATVERPITRCERHVYRITLKPGEALHGWVDQKGISILPSAIRVADQLRVWRGTVDPEPAGREQFVLLTRNGGDYDLILEAGEESTRGTYALTLETPRAATDDDLLQATGEHLIARTREAKPFQYPADAESWLQQARTACRWAGALECEANALQLLGYRRWFAADDVVEARRYLLESLAVRQKLDDRYSEGTVRNDLGVVTAHMGELLEAREHLEEAIRLRALPAVQTEPLALHNLAPVYWQLGELQKALDVEKQALESWAALGHRNGMAYAHNMLARFALQLNDPAEALRHQNEALAIWKRLHHESGIAEATTRLGAIAGATGDRRKGLAHYRESLAISEKIADPQGEAKALVRIGSVLTALGEREEAKRSLEKALEIFRKGKLDQTSTLKALGDLHAAAGEHDRALDWYRQTLAAARASGDPQPRVDALLGIARLERDRGRLESAVVSLDEATSVIETLRLRLANPEIRAAYLASRQSLYDLTIDVVMRLARHGEGLEVSERARARGLLDALAFAGVRERRSDPDLRSREEHVRHRLSGRATTLTRLTPARRNGPAGQALQREVEALTAEYREIRSALDRLEDGQAAAVLKVEQIQELLDDHTVLLEYALGDSASYLWVVTPASVRTFTLPPRAEVEAAARRVITLMPRSSQRELAGQTQLALQKLSNLIIRPASAIIARKRLAIVADGILQFISFAALPDPVTKGQPLIVGHEVVMLPSASLLATLRSRPPRRPQKTIALIADPVVADDDPRLGGLTARGAMPPDLTRSFSAFGGRFTRLPHTRSEAQKIASLVPPHERLRATDFEASRQLATGGSLARYRIIHFATHGLINAEQPELSGLVLSLYDERGVPQDGFLRLSDIYSLEFSADLAVLSACSTALGREVKREGLVGLTRGFMYAGVPRVVASLWDVRDSATAEVMDRFYRNMLRHDMKPGAALRAAQISMLRHPKWSAPFHWAAFVLQGDWK